MIKEIMYGMAGLGAVAFVGLVGAASYQLGKSQGSADVAIAQVSGPSCNYEQAFRVARDRTLLRFHQLSIAAITAAAQSDSPTLDLIARDIVLDAAAAKMMLEDPTAYLERKFAIYDTKI